MPLKSLKAALAAILLAGPAAAMDGQIMIEDPYARASSPSAKVGAAFMMLQNHGAEDDRLIAVTSDAAERVELHTHISDTNGVMRMVEVEDGILVPAGGMAALKRGGDHVMLMGLAKPFVDGETMSLTLTFEKAGEVQLDVPIDSQRQDGAGSHGGHGSHGAGTN